MNEKFLNMLRTANSLFNNGTIVDIYNTFLEQQRTNNVFNVDAFADALGLNVNREVWLDIDISGILNGRQRTIQANYFEGNLRQNFTIAHEIAHYLLHSNVDEITDFSFNRSQSYQYTEAQRQEEEEADFFAANLLMPEDLLRQRYEEHSNLSTQQLVRTLANMFQVSGRAMVKRLKDLGIIQRWVWVNV